MLLLSFPLLALSLIAYNVIIYSAGWAWTDKVVQIAMLSGSSFTLTLSDLFVGCSLILLFIEIIKATRTGSSSILDHGLSMLVFIACLVEFLLVPAAATGTFFLLSIMALIDVTAGYTVTIRAARRDFGVEQFPGS